MKNGNINKPENNKNIYIISYLLIIVLLLFLFVFFVFNKKDTSNIPLNSWNDYITEKTIKNIDDWNYIEVINNLENKWIENINDNEKKFLLISYLRQWNSYYKEDEYSKKALNLLENMSETHETLYYKWYAKEIVKDYEEALVYYNKWLELNGLTNYWKALLLNQIGHVYDFMWELEKANAYYIQSEALWTEFKWVLLNRARYELRKWNIEKAESYLLEVLKTETNKFTRSEIYSNLSTINLVKENWLEQAIDYAQKWIEENADYPYNYLALWNAYIEKWWEDLDNAKTQIEKALSLYPNLANWYKLLWIYYYIKDDFDNAIANFTKQREIADNDIILMPREREHLKKLALYDISRSYALKWDSKQSIKYLNDLFLDWLDQTFTEAFFIEISSDNWAYSKIYESEEFKEFVKKLVNN